MVRIRILFVFGFLFFASNHFVVSAQSLEEELSILDDLPEADMAQTAEKTATEPVEPESFAADSVEPPQSLQEEVVQLPEINVDDSPAPPSALTGVDSEPMAYLTSLDFQQLPDRVRLRLKTDRGIDYQIIEKAEKRQITIELQNASIAKKVLKRALDTGEFDGPVALVKAFDSRSGSMSAVKVLFQLRDFQKAQVTRVGTDLLVDFKLSSQSGKLFEISGDVPVLPETIVSSFDKMTFSGSRMNLRVKDAPLADVLALISRASGQDFVLAKSTDQKITIQMNDAPWDQVLSMILLNANMGYQKIGKIYRITPADDLRKELDEAIASEKKKKELATLETRIFPVNYAKADDLDKIVKNFLTASRGTSSVENRTNSIVVTDVAEVLDRVGTYLNKVDLQTPQVLIEGRVVQVSDDISKNLDINWRAGSGSFVNIAGATPAALNTGLRFSSSLPGLGTVTALLNLYEKQNRSKTISSPKVMVMNNEKAEIFEGREIQVASPPAAPGEPPTLTTKEALLKLSVTPSVTSDGYVRMEVELNKDDIIDAVAGTISRRGTKSILMVESGKTAVIGGVFVDVDDTIEERMSYLGGLPVIGRLFTPLEFMKKEQRELLMFISPRVLNADKATLMSTGAGTQSTF